MARIPFLICAAFGAQIFSFAQPDRIATREIAPARLFLSAFWSVAQAAPAAKVPAPKKNSAPVSTKALSEGTSVGSKKAPKKKAVLPPDHKVLAEIRAFLKKKSADLAQIEKYQALALLQKFRVDVGSLDEEFEEVSLRLELDKVVPLARASRSADALRSVNRVLTAVPQGRWVLWVREDHSRALVKSCKAKSVQDECNYWLQRIVSAFPKGSLEIKPMDGLLIQPLPGEISASRISQSYVERLEKDDTAIGEVVSVFLKRDYDDVPDLVDTFLSEYPRSVHQFRARFLKAESLQRKGKTEAAKGIYEEILRRSPWSFYAVASAERLGISLPSLLTAGEVKGSGDITRFNPWEQKKFARAESLAALKKPLALHEELESLPRWRAYSDDAVLGMIQLALSGGDHSTGLRGMTELIQRDSSLIRLAGVVPYIFPVVFEKEFRAASVEFGVDWVLLMSLSKQESAFFPEAFSSAGAMGLMQLMPVTALATQPGLLFQQLMDPAFNIRVGSKYLAEVLGRFKGNWALALAGYNAGPTRVSRWRNEIAVDADLFEFVEYIPIRETRDYVMSILRNVYWYRHLLGQPAFRLEAGWSAAPERGIR